VKPGARYPCIVVQQGTAPPQYPDLDEEVGEDEEAAGDDGREENERRAVPRSPPRGVCQREPMEGRTLLAALADWAERSLDRATLDWLTAEAIPAVRADRGEGTAM
jgi:hypothetical protein